MASQDRRERERLQTRAKIMDAARELFARLGYEAVSLRKIAEAIEYTPAAIYVHFADKESLFRELASEDFRKLAHVMPAAARIADPLVRIAMVGRAYIEFGLRHPNHYRLMFMTPQTAVCGKGLTEQQKAHLGNPTEDAYAFLRQCVVEALQKGQLRPEFREPDLAVQTLWAGVHGVTSLEITMGTDPCIQWQPIDARVEAMVWTLVRGIARDPAAYPPAGGQPGAVGSANGNRLQAPNEPNAATDDAAPNNAVVRNEAIAGATPVAPNEPNSGRGAAARPSDDPARNSGAGKDRRVDVVAGATGHGEVPAWRNEANPLNQSAAPNEPIAPSERTAAGGRAGRNEPKPTEVSR